MAKEGQAEEKPELDRLSTWRAAQRVPNIMKATTFKNRMNNALMRLYPDEERPDTGMGSIRFDGTARWPPSKFVRVSPTHSNPADVIDVLCEVWKLAPPCAIISLPPSFHRQALPSRVELVVARGLAEAALKANAWIVTSGYADGVGAHVAGNAAAFARTNLSGGARLCCIGIVPFEGARGHEALEAVGKNGVVHNFSELTLQSMAAASSPPASPPPTPPDGDASGEEVVAGKDAVTPIRIPPQPASPGLTSVESPKNKPGDAHPSATLIPQEQHHLNRHHTHFVMVDGADAMPFRMRLEKYISDYDISGDEIQTPKVLLVVCGGARRAPVSKP